MPPRKSVKVSIVPSRTEQPAKKAVIKIRPQNEDDELHGVFKERTYTMTNGRVVSAEFDSYCSFRDRPHTTTEVLRIRELAAIQHQFKVMRLEIMRALGNARKPLTSDERSRYDEASTALMKAKMREPYLYYAVAGR